MKLTAIYEMNMRVFTADQALIRAFACENDLATVPV
jgi:hypothetical protein